MSTVVLTDGKILIGGFNLSADHSEMSLEYSAEMLDVTAFGDSTRKNKGGLTMASLSGTGFWNGGLNNADQALFDFVGSDTAQPITVFANGITEGEARGGYAFKGVVENYNIGTTVGAMMTFNMSAQGRGIE
jgi:hypothetical protein